jgi:DNA-binding Xre family transcriptional regulator
MDLHDTLEELLRQVEESLRVWKERKEAAELALEQAEVQVLVHQGKMEGIRESLELVGRG